jgi:hypothetical protein
MNRNLDYSSPAMRLVMRNLAVGREPADGLLRKQLGGSVEPTLTALRRRGWIDPDNKLTPAGVDHLEKYR